MSNPAAGASFMGAAPEVTLPETASIGIACLSQEPYVDQEKLDTTVYHILARYCQANDYAVGEYDIQPGDFCVMHDKLYLKCQVVAQCQDYGKEDQGKTWRDLGYDQKEIEATALAGYVSDAKTAHVAGRKMIPMDVDTPINLYPVCLDIYVGISPGK